MKLACIFLIVATMLVLIVCSNDINGEKGMGSITVSLNSNPQAVMRSAVPYPPTVENGILNALEIIMQFTGPAPASDITLAQGVQSAVVSLVPGVWEISINAFYQGELYAQGSRSSIEVKQGQNTPAMISMNRTYNKFIINGNTYEITEGEMTFWGVSLDDESNNVDLFLSAEDDSVQIYFEMFVPLANDRLTAGTYTLNDNYATFTYSFGDVRIKDDSIPEGGFFFDVTGGTVRVSVSGTGASAIYTIDIDCPLEDFWTGDVGSIKGVYMGNLDWENWDW